MKTIVLTFVLITGAFYAAAPSQTPARPDGTRVNVITRKAVDSPELPYDAGTVRFLASTEETKAAWSMFEVKELPGYKTAWHRHNERDEAFYILEGVLTMKIGDEIAEYPAGSYIVVPRGTPHGQGNFGTVPTRVLLTFTPAGFDEFFKDRVQLFKTVKPGDPTFVEKFNELRKKHSGHVEILGTWDIKK
jgi:quercetin dioxygenase-like cupin family protein